METVRIVVAGRVFSPHDDITALEVSKLLPLFTIAAASQGRGPHDPWGYVVEHGLERHFEERK